jgi:hypothetical protein
VKKIVSLFLLSVFLLSVPGLAYSLHFCGEILIKSGIASDAKKTCICDKPQASDDCCQDQQVSLSVDDSQQSTVDYKLDAPKFVLLSAVIPQLLLKILSPSIQYSSFSVHPDVPILKVPVYLFIGSFLI